LETNNNIAEKQWIVISASRGHLIIGFICFKTDQNLEAYPDIADTNVIVIANYEDSAAEEV